MGDFISFVEKQITYYPGMVKSWRQDKKVCSIWNETFDLVYMKAENANAAIEEIKTHGAWVNPDGSRTIVGRRSIGRRVVPLDNAAEIPILEDQEILAALFKGDSSVGREEAADWGERISSYFKLDLSLKYVICERYQTYTDEGNGIFETYSIGSQVFRVREDWA